MLRSYLACRGTNTSAVCPLAIVQTNASHHRELSNRFGETLSREQRAGNHRRRDGAEAGEEDREFSVGRSDCFGLLHVLRAQQRMGQRFALGTSRLLEEISVSVGSS